MKGSLIILAALCVIAAEATSVRFISMDEGQAANGKDKKDPASEGSDSGVKKDIDQAAKEITDGNPRSESKEKMLKSLEQERSGTDNSTGSSEVTEKSKIRKREVNRISFPPNKRAMKRDSDGNDDLPRSFFSARKVALKYLSIQKVTLDKLTTGVIYAVERLEQDDNEKAAILEVLQTFKGEVDSLYANTISKLDKITRSLGMMAREEHSLRQYLPDDMGIPEIITAVNQRNPLAIIPLVTRIITAVAGAASSGAYVAKIASDANSRSSGEDLPSIIEFLEKISKTTPVDPEPPEY